MLHLILNIKSSLKQVELLNAIGVDQVTQWHKTESQN